jgi:two-component system OmpR family response regulator
MIARPDLQVLLVEDSPVICDRVTEIVNDVSGVTVADAVESEAAAVQAVNRGDIDVVVLDLQLRRGTGFGVLRAVQKLASKPVVVVFTNFAIPAYRETALRLGARHFLDKSRDYDRLPAILAEIAASRAT